VRRRSPSNIAPPPSVPRGIQIAAATSSTPTAPLIEQLSQLGIRKFETDVFADPEGGRVATPAALWVLEGLGPPPGEMRDSSSIS
jgi:hypothetical protein